MLPPQPRQIRTAVVVDDDVLVCNYLKTILETVGFHVFTEETGERGVERVVAVGPDIVLLDIRLPGMDGLSVIAALKASQRPFPVIVGMSAAWADTEQKAIALGAVAFLRKPLTPDAVISTVEGALHGRFVWIND